MYVDVVLGYPSKGEGINELSSLSSLGEAGEYLEEAFEMGFRPWGYVSCKLVLGLGTREELSVWIELGDVGDVLYFILLLLDRLFGWILLLGGGGNWGRNRGKAIGNSGRALGRRGHIYFPTSSATKTSSV
jgi:hypothetical protein